MANRNRFSHCLFSAAALNAELTHHLRHEKNQPKSGTNSRNGYSTKTVTITDGPMELR
ncbi:IS256 family transposase, partial [Salmonella enterica subsp. enterica serovar Schwarzengrund]